MHFKDIVMFSGKEGITLSFGIFTKVINCVFWLMFIINPLEVGTAI